MEKQGNFDKQDNFNFMLSTIKSLAPSQGFYGRLCRDIQGLEPDDLNNLIDSLPDFKKRFIECCILF